MTQLSVNVNKLATLRNARGKNNPDLGAWATRILDLGAFGITVHPRPDERHVRRDDVRALATLVRRRGGPEFNVEGYPTRDFLDLVLETRPHQATLVPDPPGALTSDAGWDLERNEDLLGGVTEELGRAGIRTSLFVDPLAFTRHQAEALARLKPGRCELYTEAFALAHRTARAGEVSEVYRRVAERVDALGIGLNAGHDLNLENVGALITLIPAIKEVSIGHALVCEALEYGMKHVIDAYLARLGGRA